MLFADVGSVRKVRNYTRDLGLQNMLHSAGGLGVHFHDLSHSFFTIWTSQPANSILFCPSFYFKITLYLAIVLYLVNYRFTSASLAANFVTCFTKQNEDDNDDDDDYDDDDYDDNDTRH